MGYCSAIERNEPWINGKTKINHIWHIYCSVAQSCPTLCNPMDCSTPGFPVHHHFPEFAQTHIYWVSDAIQSSGSLSPRAFSLSQHQDLFQRVSSSHQVAKVLELQFQYQSFQWVFRVDFFRIDWLIFLQSKELSRVFPASQFESINSLALSLLHGPSLASLHDYWKKP